MHLLVCARVFAFVRSLQSGHIRLSPHNIVTTAIDVDPQLRNCIAAEVDSVNKKSAIFPLIGVSAFFGRYTGTYSVYLLIYSQAPVKIKSMCDIKFLSVSANTTTTVIDITAFDHFAHDRTHTRK